MKFLFAYVIRRFCPFALSIQFNTLLFVLITVLHDANTPNTGCPVLGVHIILGDITQWKRKKLRAKGVLKTAIEDFDIIRLNEIASNLIAQEKN